MFVEGVDDLFDSFIDVAHYGDHGKLVRCRLTSMECWRSAVDKVQTWTFLKTEPEPMCTPPLQSSWLTTIGAVQQVCRKVSEELKFKLRSKT
jgi:hypothetical protein